MPEQSYKKSASYRFRQLFFYAYGAVLVGSFGVWLFINGPKEADMSDNTSWFRKYAPSKVLEHDALSVPGLNGKWQRP